MLSLLLPLTLLALPDGQQPSGTTSAPSSVVKTYGEAAANCDAYFPLRSKNLTLLKNLRARLREAGYGGWLARGRLSVSVVDLTPKDRIHYVGVNDDSMFYAASLPKIIALLAFAQGAKERRLAWTPTAERRLSSMINASSNADASWAFDKVGPEYLEEIVRRPGYCFYGDQFGGLWLGRPYRRGGATNRDPLKNLSHGATSRQVARFYTLLAKGLLVGPVGNDRILRTMGPPEKHHKFVRGLADREGAHIVARKSGTWRNFHSDSALVEHDGVRYAAVVLSDHPRAGRAMETIIQIIDDLMMEGAHRDASPPAAAAQAVLAPQ